MTRRINQEGLTIPLYILLQSKDDDDLKIFYGEHAGAVHYTNIEIHIVPMQRLLTWHLVSSGGQGSALSERGRNMPRAGPDPEGEAPRRIRRTNSATNAGLRGGTLCRRAAAPPNLVRACLPACFAVARRIVPDSSSRGARRLSAWEHVL
jgi:hypothetical protein